MVNPDFVIDLFKLRTIFHFMTRSATQRVASSVPRQIPSIDPGPCNLPADVPEIKHSSSQLSCKSEVSVKNDIRSERPRFRENRINGLSEEKARTKRNFSVGNSAVIRDSYRTIIV